MFPAHSAVSEQTPAPLQRGFCPVPVFETFRYADNAMNYSLQPIKKQRINIMTAYDFNTDEIFEIARRMESNGAKFYEDAAEGISDPDQKALLLKLASMEVEHEKTFAAMQSEFTPYEKEPTTFDPRDEAWMYLRALADTRVFFEKKIDVSSMREILKAAIDAEKDSIVFYMGMKDVVSEKLGTKRLDWIIKEEMWHIRILSKKLLALGDSK